nr:hypothetical protein [Tanacetum cinerariifolium]
MATTSKINPSSNGFLSTTKPDNQRNYVVRSLTNRVPPIQAHMSEHLSSLSPPVIDSILNQIGMRFFNEDVEKMHATSFTMRMEVGHYRLCSCDLRVLGVTPFGQRAVQAYLFGDEVVHDDHGRGCSDSTLLRPHTNIEHIKFTDVEVQDAAAELDYWPRYPKDMELITRNRI